MSDIPPVVDVGGQEFVRIDSPDDLACWVGTAGGVGEGSTVSLVIEPPAAPSAEVIGVAASIVTGFEPLVQVAASFLCERLRSAEYELSDVDLALLGQSPLPFDAPEAVVWSDATWMLRFSECALSIAEDFGIGVNFVGLVPDTVENLSEAEPLDGDE